MAAVPVRYRQHLRSRNKSTGVRVRDSTGDLVYSPEVARIESPREGLILIVVIAKDMCCKPRIVYAIDLRCGFAENESDLRSENVRPLIS